MADHRYRDVLAELRPPTRDLRTTAPGAWEGFAHLHGGAMAPGALTTCTKELIALAIAVTDRCDGCIAAHARGAAREGASPEQVAEALGVTLLMAGGPASVYAPRAWEAYREFAAVGRPGGAADDIAASAHSCSGSEQAVVSEADRSSPSVAPNDAAR